MNNSCHPSVSSAEHRGMQVQVLLGTQTFPAYKIALEKIFIIIHKLSNLRNVLGKW